MPVATTVDPEMVIATSAEAVVAAKRSEIRTNTDRQCLKREASNQKFEPNRSCLFSPHELLRFLPATRERRLLNQISGSRPDLTGDGGKTSFFVCRDDQSPRITKARTCRRPSLLPSGAKEAAGFDQRHPIGRRPASLVLPLRKLCTSGRPAADETSAFVERQAPSPVDDLANGTTTGEAPVAPRRLNCAEAP